MTTSFDLVDFLYPSVQDKYVSHGEYKIGTPGRYKRSTTF